MSTPPRRAPGTNPYLLMGFLAITALLGLLLYGVLQIGHRWNSSDGTWLPANPPDAIVTWAKNGQEWSIAHSMLSGLAVIGVLVALFFSVRLSTRMAEKRDHVDANAKHMGKGREMFLAAVTADNAKAGYTASDIVGLVIAKAVQSGELLWAGWRSTMVAIMGTGSGKTTAVAVPFALNAPGWVYGTSNKRDFPDCIWEPRNAIGVMSCFDPQQIRDTPATWYWDPLSFIRGTHRSGGDTRALIQANLFADAARKPEAKTDGFFDPAGRNLVADLLLAAAFAGLPITAAMKWVNRPERNDPVALLRTTGWRMAADDLQFAYDLNPDTKRGVFANAKGVLTFLFNESALPWICKTGMDDNRPQFSPYDFVRSEHDTLVSLSKEGVGSLGPLVAALTIAITEAAQEYAKTCPGGRLPIPGCVLLDEAANVARIEELPNWYSYFAGIGIFILTILQSRAQGEAAWGQTGMEKMMGAATHEVYGRGLSDDKVLRNLSTLLGQRDVLEYSTQDAHPTGFSGGKGSRTVTSSYRQRDILTPDEIAALPEWRAIVRASGSRPVLAELIPYWERSPEMKAAVDESKVLHGPAASVTV